jgi:leucyl-tRNA synthetase
MLRITAYADRLLEDLSKVSWPEGTRVMQVEWIGRSEGAEIAFEVEGHPGTRVEVFTTRPDTLFGATFVVLAPEHPFVERITTPARRAEVLAYAARTRGRSERERRESKDKTGEPTGAFAVHPLTGKLIPIWIADYVLWGYGTGAVMAVPGHDGRDFEFAGKFGLPIERVVRSAEVEASAALETAFENDGIACHSGPYDGLTTAACKAAITAELERTARGRKRVEYKLRDWIFSRQRYWGEPFPIYFPVRCDGDPRTLPESAVSIDFSSPRAVDRSELPLRLPDLEDFKPGEDPAGPLARAKDWRFFQKEGQWFARETNTMPQWAGSCWYYLRFIDPKNEHALVDPAKAKAWLPVDLYVGGAEHAVLHLLYARFWHKVLYDAGIVPTEEPFGKLVHQGMILGEIEYTAYVAEDGTRVSRRDVQEESTPDGRPEFREITTGRTVVPTRVEEAHVTKVGSDFVLAAEPSGSAGDNVRTSAPSVKASIGRCCRTG